MKTNGNITVYNQSVDETTRLPKWQHTQVGPVFIDSSKGGNVVRQGMNNADSVKIYIPFTSTGNYQSPNDYKNNPKLGGWTLKPGDVIVKGFVNDDITQITDLTEKYNNVFTITYVDPKDFGSYRMRHFEVGGV